MKRPNGPVTGCPAEAAMEIFGGKWRVGIVDKLKEGPLRFNEIRTRLPSVTQKVLTQQLRHLQRYGVLNRKQFERIPPHVEYSLTPLGKSLLPLLGQIAKWAEKHLPACQAAAAKNDAQELRKS